jgi:cytochrome P450
MKQGVPMSTVQLDDGFPPFVFDYLLAGDTRDPYPALAEARETTPVRSMPNPFDPSAPPNFLVHRHADVVRLFKDNVTFSSAILRESMGPAMGDQIILGMDEPEHRRHRGLVSTAFRQRALSRWEESLVGEVVNRLIDGFADRGEADLVPEFTWQFPPQVIAGILGLPQEDFRRFQRWAIAITGLHTDFERGMAASVELKDYLGQILTERRRAPSDDVISDLAVAELDGEHLDDEEIFSFLRLLLPAGVETTFRSSGNLLFLLLTHPDQLGAVRADRSLLPQAIEEGLRFEPPLLLTGRIATRDAELSGVTIPAGATVAPMLGAANRDPRAFTDPDRFDIFRDPSQHVSFAHGVHVCLGMHLARLETRVAVDALLDRLPNLRLDDARAVREDAHIHGEIFRSPTALPVCWDPA